MAVALMPLSFALIVLTVQTLPEPTVGTPRGVRESLLLAAVAFGLLLTAATEILSLLRSITPRSVAAFWALVSVACAAWCIRPPRRFRWAWPNRAPGSVLIILASAAIPVTATALIAVIAPPNNWDSMAYHMARVVHWVQNRSVAFYPTHVPRQLYMNPWGEYAILHLQILSGGDRFANLVQWSCMLGSLIAISQIARHLGAGARGQAMAAAIAATLPMGILQATSTQTDYVVGFWLACFVCFALTIIREHRVEWGTVLGAAGALALAILAKATAYLFALPFLVWLGASVIKHQHARRWSVLLAIAAAVILVNLGHYWRNWDLYGSPIGPAREGKSTYYNQVVSLPALMSNILRNTALHLETPFPAVNAFTLQSILRLHAWVGADPSDIRTTWAGLKFTRVSGMSRNDASAGNLVHLILTWACTALVLASPTLRRERALVRYVGCLLVAFLLFCGYLKWQPWNSRLHLPLFVLWSPPIAIAAERLLRRRTAVALAALLVVLASPWIVGNLFRPLAGQGSILRASRINVYFYNRPNLRQQYLDTADFLREQQCSQVGLIGDGDTWEYPLWVVLRRAFREDVRLEHVAVANVSKAKASPNPVEICAIVSFYPQDETLLLNGKRYTRALAHEDMAVYLPR
ncbi:MAG: hypothetical protein Kow00123_21840 [Anaerolineales bacterium]